MSLTWDCWQYTYSDEILKWFVNQHINIKVLLSNFFARNWVLLWEMFVHSLSLPVHGWSKQKLKIMSDHLFTHLWIVSTGFVLMQAKTSFDTPIFRLYFTFFSKMEWHQLFTINTVNILLQTFHFQRLTFSEYVEIIF